MGDAVAPLREISAPFVVPGPSGVSVRDRLRSLSPADEEALRAVGAHLGSLAAGDLRARCEAGTGHDGDVWAARKKALTKESSSRWAGSITKATHDQWALARRCQLAHIETLQAGIRTLERRLSLPLGEKGTKHAAGGYRSKAEWFGKSRRLAGLRDRLGNERTDRKNGVVRVVRGGGRLLRLRRTLDAAGLSEAQWRDQWDAARWFLSADGETGKRYGNETIRVTPAGQVSIRLPRPLAHLANAAHGRYVLTCTVAFAYRGDQWQARVEANQAVAYRIHYDTSRGRWYLTAAWQHPAVPPAPLTAARAGGMIGVDTNAGHFAAYRLDHHGNPAGRPQRFGYNLAGGSGRRDAQVRHAITRLLHWTRSAGAGAIGIEDLNFADETREKHGRNKQFRRVISGIPTGRLRARLVSMAAEQGLPVVAVDPAYTTRWGGQHWRKPLTGPRRPMTGHDAAAVAIGRRALGYPVRRRTAPPRTHQSDGDGHRAGQAGPGTRGRDGTRHPATDRPPEDRRRAGP